MTRYIFIVGLAIGVYGIVKLVQFLIQVIKD